MQEEEFDDLLDDSDLTDSSEDISNQRYIHFEFTADKGQGLLRVDKFLMDRIEGVSRNKIQQAAEAGCILVNGKAVKSNYRIKPLERVALVMDKPRIELEIIPENIPLNIVYEDDDLIVVNKPPILWFIPDMATTLVRF